MEADNIRKIFSEQLQLLAERSKRPDCTNMELCEITRTMVELLETTWIT